MQLVLIEKHGLFRRVLPEKITGRYWIQRTVSGGGLEDVLCVEGIAGEWILKSNRRAQLLDKTGKSVHEQAATAGEFYSVKLSGDDTKALIYLKPDTRDRRVFAKYTLPKSDTFTIGRSPESSLYFNNPFASGQHATLTVNNGKITVVDNNSSNGTFLNDRRVTAPAVLKPGDVISIIDLIIVIGGDFIAINNPDGNLLEISSRLILLQAPQANKIADEGEIEEASPEHLFYRSPRMKRSIIPPAIKIDPPPQEEKPDDTPLLMVIGPSITMGMSSGTMALFAVMNVNRTGGDFTMALPMIIMSVLMMTGMILFPILSRRWQKKKRQKNEVKRKEKYRAYLKDTSTSIQEEKATQAIILHENYVDLSACINRIRERERKLWERTDTHDDFLDVRLGIGDWPFAADFQVPQRSFTLDDDTLQDELFEIIDSPRIVPQVPVVVSLIKQFSMGIVGKRAETATFLKSLIFQLASLHAYDEVKFVFIYSPHESEHWDFVRWLPHVWSEDKSFRFVATEVDQVRQLSAMLEQIQSTPDDSEGAQRDSSTKYVVFALDRKLATKCEALNTVYRSEDYHQVSVMAVYDELRYLPKDCKVVLEVDSQQSKLFDRSVASGDHISFVPDHELQLDAQNLAIDLANTKLESAEAAFELPMMLTFLEMFEAGRVEHLNVLTRWKESNPVHTLEAPVGVDVTGNLCNLDLHEKAHGPHGLVAGMTGSGKSEFIMTYILSLALNYHPHEVAFVLIDYKGGGMANAFSDLPHTVGVITNLDGASVNRSLASIQSELKRRQAIFNEATQLTQVSNIDIYKYQSLYREGQAKEPLPHLFIISDEFAELKTQQPEFMEQLVSAARIGRSLGVHLILATQKPSGVVDDQIWANSKFKVCLKVQDKADSMEMIKRPDAAELVETGRFYLQVGYDELFEMGQSAWAGAAYFPSDRIERDYDDSVSLLNMQGQELFSAKPQKTSLSGGKTKQLDEVTNYLIKTADEEGIVLRQLWMPPLKSRIYLDALAQKYKTVPSLGFELEALVGEYDDPSTQTQGSVSLSLSRDGNLLLFGIAGGGKTHFVSTLLYSLVRDHTPEEVNCYVLDFGSETLKAFASAPHVGDVLTARDTEKVENLFSMLNEEFIYRRELFSQYGGSFQSYIENASDPMPNIVTVINNYSAFSEQFEDADEWLQSILQQGVKYGMYFIFTAATASAIRHKMQQNFGQRICLQVNDTDEYSELFGQLQGLLPAQTPGRGLFRSEEGTVFEFQSALISEELADSTMAINEWCDKQASKHSGQKARSVPALPEVVSIDFLMEESDQLEHKQLAVGVDKDTLEPAIFDFGEHAAAIVMSSGSAYQQFLVASAGMIAAAHSDTVGFVGSDGDSFSNKLKIVVPNAMACSIEAISVVADDSQDADDKAKELLSSPPAWLIIPGLAKMYDSLSYEQKEPFIRGLMSLAKDHNTVLLLGDSASDFSSIAYEPWVSEVASLESGLWIGNGFGDQFHLKTSGSTFFEDVGAQFGLVLKDGEARLTKMLQIEEE